jgi:hypothetical protein
MRADERTDRLTGLLDSQNSLTSQLSADGAGQAEPILRKNLEPHAETQNQWDRGWSWLPNRNPMPYSACRIGPNNSFGFIGTTLALHSSIGCIGHEEVAEKRRFPSEGARSKEPPSFEAPQP